MGPLGWVFKPATALRSPMKTRSRASESWRSRRRGPTSGSARRRKGHLQATGRDARGRKQYRYHARWREVRDETKYDRMIAFGEALPQIRARTERDLALPGLPREKVLATVVQLLEKTLIRVGNDEYAKAERVLRPDDHARPPRRRSTARPCGSSSAARAARQHAIDLRDRTLARDRQAVPRSPRPELFQYIDEDGERQASTRRT